MRICDMCQMATNLVMGEKVKALKDNFVSAAAIVAGCVFSIAAVQTIFNNPLYTAVVSILSTAAGKRIFDQFSVVNKNAELTSANTLLKAEAEYAATLAEFQTSNARLANLDAQIGIVENRITYSQELTKRYEKELAEVVEHQKALVEHQKAKV